MNPFTMFSNPKQNGTNELQEQLALQRNGTMYGDALPGRLQDDIALDRHFKEMDNLTRWQQDLAPELQQMIFDLRMLAVIERDANGAPTKVEQVSDEHGKPLKPIANNLFIWKIITICKPHLSKNLMMCNLSEERIQRETRSLYYTLIEDLAFNYARYDLQKADMSYVIRLFKSTVLWTFFRAYRDGERVHQRAIYKFTDVRGQHTDVNKKNDSTNMFGGRK